MEYKDALSIAWKRLSDRDPKLVARAAEGEFYNKANRISIKFLSQNYIVDLKERRVSCKLTLEKAGQETKVKDYISVLILHYMIGVKNIPLTDYWMGFKELESGQFYYDAFSKRCIRPLVEAFANEPPKLARVAGRLDARPVSMGEVGIELNIFPRLPIRILVWGGDEEISGNANILFDRTANQFLETEDLVVATSQAVYTLLEKIGE